MATPIPPPLRLTAALVLLLAMWGLQPSTAQSPPPATPESKGPLAITGDKIEQRARFLVRLEITRDRLRLLQEEVVRFNPGKSREELIAILRERQKEFGAALTKYALESARNALMPELRRKAEAELIDEQLKLQSAKELGVEVTDEEVKSLLQDIAAHNKMTYEDFAQHLKGRDVDIATMGERLRARKAWHEVFKRRYGGSSHR